MFMCVEIMLNAVNLSLVSYSRQLNDSAGQVTVFFVMVVAAAEVVVGLAILVAIFRRRRSSSADDVSLLGDDGMSDVHLKDAMFLIPAFPFFGAAVLLVLGRRL